MFTTLILVVHVIVCVALILIILLQSGKGADIGAVFGGGSSQTVFGSSGATPFLSKVTIGAAVIFMITSIILTYFSGKGISVEKSIVSESTTPVPTTREQLPVKEGAPDAAAPKNEGSPEAPKPPTAPAATPVPADNEAKPAPASEAAPAPPAKGAESPPAK